MKLIHNYSASDVNSAYSRGAKHAINLMLRLLAWALLDVLDLPAEDIQKVCDFIVDKSSYVTDKEISESDIGKMILDETGVQIKHIG